MPTETARIPDDVSGRSHRLPVGGVSWRHTFHALRHRNYRLFFLGANTLSFIAVIAGLLMMRLPPFVRKIDIGSPAEHAWNGIVYSFQHPRDRTILLLFLAVGVFSWSYMVIMPAFARDVLGRGADGFGILMSASGTGALVGALVVATFGHRFTPRKLALGFGAIVCAVSAVVA